MGEDILQEIPDEKLPLLVSLYKTHQEQAPHVYSLLETCIKWRKQKPNSNYITVFGVEDDWLKTGTFIALMQFSCYDLFVYTLEESCRTLFRGLSETKKIDWSRRVLWYGVSGRHVSLVEDFVRGLGQPNYIAVITELTVVDREKAMQFEWTCPDEVYMEKLDPSHAIQINSVWPHKSENSEGYLSALIEMNNSLGLFLKSDNSLVCWVLRSPMGQMCNLQTDIEHKRRGYAAIITKAISKQIAEDGFHPLGTVVQGNVASEIMFSKLGFRSIDTSTFIIR